MSQTITSSDLIPNENIMSNKRVFFFSYLSLACQVVASCAADMSLVASHPSSAGLMDGADSLWISCLPMAAVIMANSQKAGAGK